MNETGFGELLLLAGADGLDRHFEIISAVIS